MDDFRTDPTASSARSPSSNLGNLPLQLGDRAIELLRATLNERFFEKSAQGFGQLAGTMTPVAALLGLALGVLTAIKSDSLMVLLLGLGWVVAVGLAYYCGARLLPTCAKIVQNGRTSISSPELLDVLGLIMGVASVGTAFAGLYFAIRLSETFVLFACIGAAGVLAYFIAMALHPTLVSTDVDPEGSAGADALAVALFFTKGLVRLSPMVMGGLVTLGTIQGLQLTYAMFRDEFGLAIFLNGPAFATLVFVGLLYPVLAYITFIFTYLATDVILAILRLHRLPTIQ